MEDFNDDDNDEIDKCRQYLYVIIEVSLYLGLAVLCVLNC